MGDVLSLISVLLGIVASCMTIWSHTKNDPPNNGGSPKNRED